MSEGTDSSPCQNYEVVSKAAGRDMLLYNPATDAVHVLNPTAYAVWQLCDGRHTAGGMAAALAGRFAGTAGHDLPAEIATILELFRQAGLIQPG